MEAFVVFFFFFFISIGKAFEFKFLLSFCYAGRTRTAVVVSSLEF